MQDQGDTAVKGYVDAMVSALEEKQAEDIEVLYISDLTTIADYFVVCTGTSTTHIKTLSEEVESLMEKNYQVRPHHIEGYEHANWILVDYGFAVVHIFHRDTRKFYSLERLWADAPKYAKEADIRE